MKVCSFSIYDWWIECKLFWFQSVYFFFRSVYGMENFVSLRCVQKKEEQKKSFKNYTVIIRKREKQMNKQTNRRSINFKHEYRWNDLLTNCCFVKNLFVIHLIILVFLLWRFNYFFLFPSAGKCDWIILSFRAQSRFFFRKNGVIGKKFLCKAVWNPFFSKRVTSASILRGILKKKSLALSFKQ